MADRADPISRSPSQARAAAVARGIGVARAALGLAAVAAPRAPAIPWVGRTEASRPAVRLLARALGGRDLALGLGAACARSESLATWAALGALADVVDAAATVREFRRLPRWGRVLVLTSTVAVSSCGAFAAAALGSGHAREAGSHARIRVNEPRFGGGEPVPHD